jgi:Zn-dependent peptidase ImmA (M78 family)
MLLWAIERAGFSLDEMVRKEPQLDGWLKRERLPTFKQLQRFAKRVYLPFGYLFLEEPPEETLAIPFFRTEEGLVRKVPINVFDTIQLLKQRQDWLSDYLQENGFDPLGFVGSHDLDTEFELLVADMRKVLGLPRGWAKDVDDWESALTKLNAAIEEIGIVVSFNSIVGSNAHRPIQVSDCRGFVLVDPYCPFLFVNSRDAKSAQMFTLIHELAHVFLGQSAGTNLQQLQPSSSKLERLCDAAAAEFLVPSREFLQEWEYEQNFAALSRLFKVSQIVIARKALDLDLISRDSYFAFYNKRQQAFRESKQLAKDRDSDGGNYYWTMKKRLSPLFISHVQDAVNSGQLLYSDAYRFTGLSGDNFATLVTDYLGRSGE